MCLVQQRVHSVRSQARYCHVGHVLKCQLVISAVEHQVDELVALCMHSLLRFLFIVVQNVLV